MSEMKLHEKLLKIQTTLKAGKSERNKFGNFDYRSLEGILASAKPILAELGCTIILSDSIEMLGDRFYIKATATVSDGIGSISAVAYAREALSQKGMAEGQLSGSTSSYARKYAISGLFAIDNNKELDAQDNTMIDAPEKPKQATSGEIFDCLKAAKDIGQLIAIWNELSQEERATHEVAKNAAKLRIGS